MTNTKVTVTKEVAEAIEELREQGVTTDTLLQALVNGYEVEKSPEDKVREYYEGILDKVADGSTDEGTREIAYHEGRGIAQTLDLLGISIKGVNV